MAHDLNTKLLDTAPHSVAYSADRETVYATHPTLGVVTSTHILTSQTRLVVPRGIIREPTSICFASGTSEESEDDDDFHMDECDALYIADASGCRIWRVRLSDSEWTDVPELIYQSYRSPAPNLMLTSLSDYARDDCSDVAKAAREDEQRRIRGVTVHRARGLLFWMQGAHLMCASLDMELDEQADQRRDLWVVEEGLEWVDSLSVDSKERWLRLDGTGGQHAQLFLADLFPEDEEDDELDETDGANVDNLEYSSIWKDVIDDQKLDWSHVVEPQISPLDETHRSDVAIS